MVSKRKTTAANTHGFHFVTNIVLCWWEEAAVMAGVFPLAEAVSLEDVLIPKSSKSQSCSSSR